MRWKAVIMPFGNAGSKALQNAFEAVYVGKERPRKAAMFGNVNAVAENLHKFYFSPQAVAIFRPTLEACGAVDCGPPKRDDCFFVIGDAEASNLLAES